MTSARDFSRAFLVALLLASPVVAGCISKRPTLHVALVAGTGGLLDQFSNVDLAVKDVYVQQSEKAPDVVAAAKTVDLVQLTAGRHAELASKPYDADTYERVGVELNTVQATTLDGQSVRVSAFNDKLYAVIPFQLVNGKESTFTLALTIARDSTTGGYVLRPVPAESFVK